jgi:predicted  nucleic acid-binding Zn-ribbon protein
MMVLKSELERLNDLLVNKTKELDEYRQKDFQYINEIERLNNTLRLKVEESLRYENAHGDLLNKIKMIEERNNQIVNEYNVLRNTK